MMAMIRFRMNPRPSSLPLPLLHFFFLRFLPGIYCAGVVTLESIRIFNTHEWLSNRPTVYFHCQGENTTILPDVKKTHHMYTFKGEESWQPLTELADKKCKRCGFYEKDTLLRDDVFDEWEFCPSDFTTTGKYVRFKEKEFNATFLCPQCVETDSSDDHGTNVGGTKRKGTNVALVIAIISLVLIVSGVVVAAAYRYWQRKKREHDQARFLKLFEDDDDIEDELGLGDVM